ncbi:MAG: hypothetical protein QW801_05405 [Candidatus Caldarchaeum sp.]
MKSLSRFRRSRMHAKPAYGIQFNESLRALDGMVIASGCVVDEHECNRWNY